MIDPIQHIQAAVVIAEYRRMTTSASIAVDGRYSNDAGGSVCAVRISVTIHIGVIKGLCCHGISS
jgi:hypothetical protein